MYKELKELYMKNRQDIFAMAVAHILDKGFDFILKLTDEDIQSIEGSGMMSASFAQDLTKFSKDITSACDNPVELIQFCQAEDVFDTKFYANKLPNYQLVEALQYATIFMREHMPSGYRNEYGSDEKAVVNIINMEPEDYCTLVDKNKEETEKFIEDFYE